MILRQPATSPFGSTSFTPIVALLAWVIFCLPLHGEEERRNALEERLAESVKYLASDDLGGRGIGTDGLDRAANYLAERFAEIGLKTDVFDGSPYQTFTIADNAKLGKEQHNRLEFASGYGDAEKQRVTLQLGRDFNTLAIGSSGELDVPLVFAGYGITASKEKYDDYAGVDVKGKAVVIIRKEPQQNDPKSVFNGQRNSPYALFNRKVDNAYQHGAAAVILVNDQISVDRGIRSQQRQWNTMLDRLEQLRDGLGEDASQDELRKRRHEVGKLARRVYELSERLNSDSDQVLGVTEAGQRGGKIPVFFCSRRAIDPLIRSAFEGKSLADVERGIDQDLNPQSRPLGDWRVRGEAKIVYNRAEVKNVIGILEGQGPLAEETVIVGAHYDHIGRGGTGSLAPWTNDIHNGADDNASGVAGLLEIARRFASADSPPPRRIVFIAFTAEERGLLGSARYVREPRFSLEKTVAMINLDMIGRLSDGKLIVQGKDAAVEFEALIDDVSKNYDFEIVKKAGGHGPSDHSSFYGKRIPAMHIFTGTHRDYHRPSDDFEKINLAGMGQITQLAGDLVESIVTTPQRPTYKESRRRGRRSDNANRPYLGIAPDYNSQSTGVAVLDVVQDSPADKAGMQPADVIVQFGDVRIKEFTDLQSALRKHKPTDQVQVVFQRDGKEITATVTLAQPR